jgi:predicted nucleic acid-binding protein
MRQFFEVYRGTKKSHHWWDNYSGSTTSSSCSRIGWHLARLDLSTMTLAAELRRCHGLLVNDSLLAATAAREGIVDFASADADFERVEELRLFRPGDL